MLKKIYQAGFSFAEKVLPKALADRNFSDDDNRAATGAAGLAIGNVLQTVGLVGVGFALLAAVATGLGPAGLSVAAFLSLGCFGTAMAGVGIFGKGMVDGGDKLCGIVTLGRELRKSIVTEIWKDLRGRSKHAKADVAAPQAEAASTFRVEATPANDFSKATSGASVPDTTAAIQAAPVQKAPGNP